MIVGRFMSIFTANNLGSLWTCAIIAIISIRLFFHCSLVVSIFFRCHCVYTFFCTFHLIGWISLEIAHLCVFVWSCDRVSVLNCSFKVKCNRIHHVNCISIWSIEICNVIRIMNLIEVDFFHILLRMPTFQLHVIFY